MVFSLVFPEMVPQRSGNVVIAKPSSTRSRDRACGINVAEDSFRIYGDARSRKNVTLMFNLPSVIST
jgi:hypothetical protein